LNYSLPKDGIVSKEELFEHLHSRADLPDAIPYRTCYYAPDWGFCVEHARLSEFTDDAYEVYIDATLEPGSLTLGEGRIQGETNDEILFTTYSCHPSMANNELSGPLVQTDLFKRMLRRTHTRFSYRFVYASETIGDLVYLSQNMEALKENMVGGAVLTMLGNDNAMMFEPSARQDSIFDRAARNVLEHRYPGSSIGRRNPKGRAAQRQYCSPGLKLPLSVLSRALGGSYPEYHTSLDTKSVIRPDRYLQTVQILEDIIDVIEQNDRYLNQRPFGEPFMSKYDLGTPIGGEKIQAHQLYCKCLLHMSDGDADLIDIANKLDVCMLDLLPPVQDLVTAGLLMPARSACNPL
jgi:aminopeptidase-like protein